MAGHALRALALWLLLVSSFTIGFVGSTGLPKVPMLRACSVGGRVSLTGHEDHSR